MSKKNAKSLIPLIEKALADGETVRNVVISLFTDSEQLKNVVEYLIGAVSSEKNKTKKEQLLYFLEDLIINKKDIKDDLEVEQIKRLFNALINYSLQSIDTEFIDKMQKAFNVIFSSVSDELKDETYSKIIDSQGLYSILAAVVIMNIKKDLIVKGFPKLIDILKTQFTTKLVGVCVFMELNQLQELGEECIVAYDQFGCDEKLVEIIKQLLISGDDLQQVALRLIAASFVFLPDDRGIIMFQALSSSIIKILNECSDKNLHTIASIFSNLPTGEEGKEASPKSQLLSYVTDLATHVKECEGEFANQFISFIEKRHDFPEFNIVVGELFKNYSTLRAAIIIAAKFGIFEKESAYPRLAFPEHVLDANTALSVLDIAKFLIKNNKVTKDVFIIMTTSVLSIICNAQFTKDATVKASVISFVEHYAPLYNLFPQEFINLYKDNITKVEDFEILCCLAEQLVKPLSEFKEAEIAEIEKDKFLDIFMFFTKHFIGDESHLEHFSTLLNVFNPKINEKAKNYAMMFDLFVPKEYIPEIKGSFMKMIDDNKDYCNFIMYLPDLTLEDINKVVGMVSMTPKSKKDDSQVNKDLFINVFKAMSLRYSGNALTVLTNIAMEKEKGGFLFFGSKQKSFSHSIKIAVLVSLASVVSKLPAEDLTKEVQTNVYEIIANSIPATGDIKNYPELSCLTEVFPLLSAAMAPKKLLEKVVCAPMFAESLPYLINKQKYAKDFIKDAFDVWINYLMQNGEAMKMNDKIANMIFGVDIDSKEYSNFMEIIFKCFKEKDPIPFLDLAYYLALHSVEKKLNVDKKLFNKILISVTPFALCVTQDIRAKSLHLLIAVFNVKVKETDDPLNEVDLILNEETAVSLLYELIKRIIAQMDHKFSKVVLENIAKKKVINFPISLIISAIIEVNGKHLLKKAAPSLLFVINSLPQIKGKGKFQLMMSLIDLLQKSMELFLPVLLTSKDLAFKRELIALFLKSEKGRAMFFEKYCALLLNTTDNLDLFQILPPFIMAENSYAIDPHEFGKFMQLILIWIISFNANEGSLSHSSVSKAKEDIMQCIVFIMEKTNVGTITPFELDFKGFDGLVKTLKSFTEVVSRVDSPHLMHFNAECSKLLETNNESFKLAAGIVSILFESKFGNCTNLSSKQLCSKVFISISIAFKTTNNSTRRKLASLIPENIPREYMKNMHKDEAIVVFDALVESICSDEKLYLKESLESLNYVLPKLRKKKMEKSIEKILTVCRKAAETLPFSVDLLDLLEVYFDYKVVFTDFVSDSKLNLIYLLKCLKDAEAEVKQRIADLINKLIATLPEIDLKRAMKEKEIVKLSNEVVECMTKEMVSDDLIVLIMVLIKSTKNIKSKDADEFRAKTVKMCTEFISLEKYSTKIMEILKEIL